MNPIRSAELARAYIRIAALALYRHGDVRPGRTKKRRSLATAVTGGGKHLVADDPFPLQQAGGQVAQMKRNTQTRW